CGGRTSAMCWPAGICGLAILRASPKCSRLTNWAGRSNSAIYKPEKQLPPAAPAYRAAGGALYAFVQPAILFRRNPLPLHPVQFTDDFDHFFISQGQLFHFCPIHWNGEVEDNLPDPVAVWLLFREQLDSLDKCPHELFPLPLGSDFTGMIERQQQTTDHVRNKGVKVVC